LANRHDLETVVLSDPGAEVPAALEQHQLRSSAPVPRLLLDLAHPRREWSVDLLHVQYVRPPRCDVPVVTTIHDISFEHFPALFKRGSRIRMKLTIPWTARRSSAVITGSEFSRQDLITTYGLDPERVRVTPYAADPQFIRLPAEEVDRRLARFGIQPGYLLCVGNLQPRKNLRRLIEAYAGLRSDVRPHLVIVGQAAWQYNEIFAAIRRHRLTDNIHFTGFVRPPELVGLYSGAAAFAFPSLYEGFGLPVIEALACGVPTIASNRSSIPEVAGDAALLVDPENVAELRSGLERVLQDDGLRQTLMSEGPRRAAKFSWERCAEATVECYLRALG
jgi:glycosyltransferase involved in cell wall biosynthesis